MRLLWCERETWTRFQTLQQRFIGALSTEKGDITGSAKRSYSGSDSVSEPGAGDDGGRRVAVFDFDLKEGGAISASDSDSVTDPSLSVWRGLNL